MHVVFWHTNCRGLWVVFLVLLLGFFCFGPANLDCIVLSLPEVFLYRVYFTVVLYAVPPWQTDALSRDHVRLFVLRVLRSA